MGGRAKIEKKTGVLWRLQQVGITSECALDSVGVSLFVERAAFFSWYNASGLRSWFVHQFGRPAKVRRLRDGA